jgi:hypothetical protein
MKPTLWPRLLLSSAAAVVLVTAAGCPPFRNAADRQRRDNELKAIGLAYHSLNDAKGTPPKGPDDLAPFLADFPDALQALKSGEIVFLYGVPIRVINLLDGTSQTVLAYEKDAPNRGGLVLMADGSTQTMSPDEFAKAPKAKLAPQ